MPGIFLTTNIFAHVGGFFYAEFSGGIRALSLSDRYTDEYGKVRRKVLVRFAVNHDYAAVCFERYRGVFRHGCEAVAAERAVRMRANFCPIRSKSRATIVARASGGRAISRE